jgi:O-antigen ligase
MSQNSFFLSDFDIKKDAVIIGYSFFLVSLALEFYVNEFRTFALLSLFVSLWFSQNLRLWLLNSSSIKICLFFPIIAIFSWFFGPYGSEGLKTFDWIFCLAIGNAASVSRPREAIFFLLIIPLVVIFASFFKYIQYYFGLIQFEDFFYSKNRLKFYNDSTNRMGLTFSFAISISCGLLFFRNKIVPLLYILLPILLSLCIMTQSRSSFFSVGVVIVVAFIYGFWFHDVKSYWPLIVAISFAILGFGVFSDNSRIMETLTGGSLEYLFNGREDIWRAAWEIFQKSPIFGFGVDSFHDTLGEHLAIPGNAERFPGLPVPNIFWNAHQIVLGILAEMGLAGLSIFIYLVIRGLRIGFANSPETLAPLFMLIAYLVAGIGGYGFHRSWNSAFFFLSLGLIEGVYMAKSALLHKRDS